MPIFNASEIKKHRLVQLNEGEDVLRIKTDSAQGVVIEDGSATRSIVTAGMLAGVPTGNFT